jgi:hypothetical protein
MPPLTPDNIEKKAVLVPQGLGKILITGLQGNVLALGSQREAVQTLLGESVLQERIFPSGPDGVAAKQEFSKEGGVIVQKGIVIEPNISNRILMHRRTVATPHNPGHRVVVGSSILLSGDGRKDVKEIIDKKLILPDTLKIEDIPTELIALGGSVAKEITYLFLLYRLQIDRNLAPLLDVTDSNTDELGIETRRKAARLVKDKPLEAAILRNWNEF